MSVAQSGYCRREWSSAPHSSSGCKVGEGFRAVTSAVWFQWKRSLHINATAKQQKYCTVFRETHLCVNPVLLLQNHLSGDADKNLRQMRSGACRLLTSECVQLLAVIFFNTAPGQRGCSLAAPLICVLGGDWKNQHEDESLKFSLWRTWERKGERDRERERTKTQVSSDPQGSAPQGGGA